MRISLFQVDAFTEILFRGNPAAVCPLKRWLPDETLQCIAAENNLSETAFFIRNDDHYELRWFTPKMEVDLCGHATLATAFVILEMMDRRLEQIRFQTRSGLLTVAREGDCLAMVFPSRPGTPCDPPPALVEALGVVPRETLFARDYLAVLPSEAQVKAIQPDMYRLTALDGLGVIVSARGDSSDFVSRFFAPKAGVAEDPVTGSAHCTLIPYWADRLGKPCLHARQVSQRGGELFCELLGDQVKIAGKAVLYSEGFINL